MLSHLRRLYATELQQTRYDNPHYRAEKLKDKLQKHPRLGSKLEFTLVETGRGKLPFYLVFNSSTKTSSAIAKAYQLASQDPMRDVGMILRGAILQAYEQADDAQEKWPPDPMELIVQDGVIPHILQRFLGPVLTGSETVKTSRAERIMLSIGQDICRTVTNGE
ncbi:uncharacterized protein LOC143254621 [Tachypleus tridentatus]|uniref:uncharacterized protein LOC143254621 n=1 Tax=Tachypleus tridentatus TaxID=6853 RepID=UPI003FD16500